MSTCEEAVIPTIIQSLGGDPTELFFTRYNAGDTALAQSGSSFYWASEGMSGDTPVWSGGVVVEGVGLSYLGGQLAAATSVTTLRSVDSLYPSGTVPSGGFRVEFSGLNLSAADTMAILQGNATRLDNIIAANVWNYFGSGYDDTFTAGGFNDTLNGGGGADTLYGAGGNDIIQGGGGVDRLEGGDGNDIIDGGIGGSDLLYGGTGNDTFYVDSNSDRVRESVGEGFDTVYASDDFALFPAAEIEVLALLNPSVVATINLTGNSFAQRIVGGAGINQLDGKAGNDVLDGGAGADVLLGGAGNDTYVVDNAGDIVDESVAGSDGIDMVRSSISFSLVDAAHVKGAVESITLLGTANLNALGSAANNLLVGNAGANTLNGGGGADTMRGMAGNDIYTVDRVGDVVDESIAGSGGIDLVRSAITFNLLDAAQAKGLIENVTLVGAANANIVGNNLANLLVGNTGANIIAGGFGNDTLTGGAGNDIFLFNTAPNSTGNVDRLTDMNEAGNDTIRLENAVFTTLAAGALAPGTLRIGTAAVDANDRIIYNSSTGELFYDANANAAGGSVRFAILDPGLTLTGADFFVV